MNYIQNPNGKSLGRHILLELYNCDADFLNQTETIEKILVQTAELGNATIVETSFHQFSPFGVSGVVVIAESHITIHTWPEHQYAAIDLFTCDNEMDTKIMVNYLVQEFKAGSFEEKLFLRGIPEKVLV